MEAAMHNIMKRCPECGLELEHNSPLGVCARCLLQAALPDSAIAENDATWIETTGRVQEAESVSGNISSAEGGDEDSSALGASARFFGDYELLEELASGGMGTVFRARQTRLNRIVALKMIRVGQLATATEIERFHREAESAASLDHPAIISVYEVGEQEGQHYFSMRLIENGSLARWIDARHSGEIGGGLNRDDLNDCARILASVARAIHFAHQRRILHRDLKPSNILLDEDGQPYVTDFGLAQRIATDNRLTATGTLMGTPGYMAPEQAAGNRGALTTSTDVYGLGAILYEMLTGKPPFAGETPIDTVLQVLDSEPRKPSSWCPVDRDLETICLRCLEKDPVQRYGSAETLADDLERWLRREPIQARRIGVMERIVKWSRRRTLVASMAVLLVIVATAGCLAVSWQLHETRLALELAHQTAIAEATARAPVLSPRRVLAHDGAVLSSVFSPDGSRVLTASHDKTAAIWDAMTGERIAVLEGHTAVLSKAEFSSDGRLILTVSYDGTNHYSHVDPVGQTMTTWHSGEYGDATVRVWDATTGKEVAPLAGHTAEVTDANFSPDGSRVITCSYDKTARLWDVTTGTELLRLDGHQSAILSAVFSPDGRHVMTSSFGTEFEDQLQEGGGHSSSSSSVNEHHLALVWDAETGKQLFGLRNRASSSRTRAVYSPDGRWIATAAEQPKNVALWDAQSGKRVTSLTGHTHEVNRIRFTQDSSRLVTASSDATSRVYEVPTGVLVATMNGHDESVLDATFATDGRRVVTASADRSVRVWETNTGKGLALLKGHEDRVYCAAFSPDGLLVATASLDGTAAIWRSATLEQLSVSLDGHRGDVTSVEFSPDGRRVLTASHDGSARIWDANSGQPLAVLKGHSSLQDEALCDRLLRHVRSAHFSPDGTQVVTGTEETHATITPLLPGPPEVLSFNPVRLFDAETGAEAVQFEGLECGAQFATFSPDGRLVVSTPDAKVRLYTKARFGMSSSTTNLTKTSVRILDARTGDQIHELKDHSGVVHMAAFSPDGRRLATMDEQHIRLFDVETGNEIARTTDQHPPQTQIEFRADGQQILSRGWSPVAYLLDASDLSVIQEISGHEETLTDARFSPDGQLIATASADGTARIWNAESGEQQQVLGGHRNRVLFAVFDPTGGLLATSSEDRRVRLWDVQSGKQLIVLEGHKQQVVGASFSPDGHWLGTASEDYTASLWPVHVFIDN